MKRDSSKDILKILDSLGIESKANEAMHSTQAGFGDEFVPDDLAQSVIEIARDKSVFLNRLPSENVIEMPSQPYNLPTEAGDPVFYASAESTDGAIADAVSSSKAGTGQMQLDAKKYTAIVYLSGELDEDSRIAGGMQSYITTKLGKAFSSLVDKSVVNGDVVTAGTGNVNSDDGAPTAGTYYLQQDGLVKQALSSSAGASAGTMDTADFKKARQLLGLLGQDPAELLWLFNLETYYELLTLAQLETLEKRGSSATIIDGTVASIQGVEVASMSAFGKAEADGKQSATSGNNTLGRFLLIHMPSLYFGWRRKMKIVVDYLPQIDKYRICAHSRFAHKVNTANSQKPVSMMYNVTLS